MNETRTKATSTPATGFGGRRSIATSLFGGAILATVMGHFGDHHPSQPRHSPTSSF